MTFIKKIMKKHENNKKMKELDIKIQDAKEKYDKYLSEGNDEEYKLWRKLYFDFVLQKSELMLENTYM